MIEKQKRISEATGKTDYFQRTVSRLLLNRSKRGKKVNRLLFLIFWKITINLEFYTRQKYHSNMNIKRYLMQTLFWAPKSFTRW